MNKEERKKANINRIIQMAIKWFIKYENVGKDQSYFDDKICLKKRRLAIHFETKSSIENIKIIINRYTTIVRTFYAKLILVHENVRDSYRCGNDFLYKEGGISFIRSYRFIKDSN